MTPEFTLERLEPLWKGKVWCLALAARLAERIGGA